MRELSYGRSACDESSGCSDAIMERIKNIGPFVVSVLIKSRKYKMAQADNLRSRRCVKDKFLSGLLKIFEIGTITTL